MCLLVLAWQSHPRYRLIFAGNRDEFHQRPTSAAGWWRNPADVLAGKDLEAGGTWLGVSRAGRFGVVTNFRDPDVKKPNAPSRGGLVLDWLASNRPTEFLQKLQKHSDAYSGFNLLVGDRRELHYLTNKGESQNAIEPGVHGLSNHVLDTEWPKVRKAKQSLHGLLASETVEANTLLALLADRRQAPDEELPNTGVGIDLERFLSPAFIVGEQYGTRSSSVILVEHGGTVSFVERRFGSTGRVTDTQEFNFTLPDI